MAPNNNLHHHRVGESDGLAVLKSQLAAARQQRKQAESDAQMLANRLLLLKAETEKAQRKIEETKSRTEFIHRVQRESEQRLEKKIQLTKAVIEQNNEAKAKYQSRKQSGPQLTMDERLAVVKAEKDNRAKQLKEDHLKNLLAIKQQREEERRQAIQKKLDIQRQHELARRKKEEEIRNRREQVKRQVFSRIEREQIEAKDKQAEIEKMAKLEADLLKELTKTQESQQKAYDDLEIALRASRCGSGSLDAYVDVPG